MSQDWYARKFNPHQQAPQRQYVPPSPPARNPYQTVPGQHQVPPQPPPPGSVNTNNFMEMASQWRGGPAMRQETQNCPQCSSPRYYSRAKSVSRGPAPAPHCFDCGFNGLFEQGDPTTWGAM